MADSSKGKGPESRKGGVGQWGVGWGEVGECCQHQGLVDPSVSLSINQAPPPEDSTACQYSKGEPSGDFCIQSITISEIQTSD